jgi:PAP2 superfamily
MPPELQDSGTFAVAARSSAVREGRLLQTVQTVAVAVSLVLIAALMTIAGSPYIAFAIAGVFVMHIAIEPSRNALVRAAAAGAGFAAVYFLHHGGIGKYFGYLVAIPSAFLGMGSIFTLISEWIWAGPEEKAAHLSKLWNATLIPMLCMISMAGLAPAAALTPKTYDRLLYVFDTKFGGPPSWVIARLFHDVPWLHAASEYVYNSLPLGLSAGLAVQWRRRTSAPADFRRVVAILGFTGFLLYQVCPVAGPLYLFPHEFPSQVPAVAGLPVDPSPLAPVPRNGMPSLHLAWTLLLFWNARDQKWAAVVTGTYCALTALATLGTGEHYLADLIVAVPFAMAVQAFCTRTNSIERHTAIAVCGTIALMCLIAFRAGAVLWIPGGAPAWILAGAVAALPVAAVRRVETHL